MLDKSYLKLIFENITDGVTIIQAEDGICIDVNNAFTQISGWRREEVIGKTAQDINIWFNPKDREQMILQINNLGYASNLEFDFRCKNGQIKTCLMSAKSVTINNRPYIITNTKDISNLKTNQKILEQSKELFEKTFKSQLDAVLILDASTPPKILNCNPAFINIFGYEIDEVIGRTTNFLHVSEDKLRAFHEKLRISIKKQGFLLLDDFNMKRKDGTIFFSEHSVIPLLNKKKERIGWVSSVRDITKRKQSEKALKDSEERYKVLVEDMPVMICRFLLDGTLTFVNSYYCDYFKKKKKSLLDIAFFNLFQKKIVKK